MVRSAALYLANGPMDHVQIYSPLGVTLCADHRTHIPLDYQDLHDTKRLSTASDRPVLTS